MGNCINHKARLSWAEEEEEEEGEEELLANARKRKPGRRSSAVAAVGDMMEGEGKPWSVGGSAEVKIKLTKQQLEELLRSVKEGGGLPVQQVLVRLMSGGAGGEVVEHHAAHWRPTLQSIPETAES